jgi:hypothetical protein
MTKSDFCSLLNAIKDQADEDTAFSVCASQYFGGRVGTAANVHLISAVVRYLDSVTKCCNYVHCWVFEKDFGRVKGTTEMAYELRDIQSSEELYEFINHKNEQNL